MNRQDTAHISSQEKEKKHFSINQIRKKCQNTKIDQKSAQNHRKEESKGCLKSMENTQNAQQEDFENFHPQDYDLQENCYQFSEEIMKKNLRNESRLQKQRSKIKHLDIYDSMLLISSHLGLTKQIFYRAAFMIKRFMLLEQRLKDSRVTISNSKTYGLAALLISSKFQNIGGNFLAKVSYITNTDGSGKIDKKQILECQSYILQILNYSIPTKIIVIEVFMRFITRWNEWVSKESFFEKYSIRFIIDNGQSQKYEVFNTQMDQNQNQGKQQYENIQLLVYLIDFIMIRKLIEVRLKDMNVFNQEQFYLEIIMNVHYHILNHMIVGEDKEKYKVLRGNYQRFIDNYYPLQKSQKRLNKSIILRRSRLLCQQIKRMLQTQQKSIKLTQTFKQRKSSIQIYINHYKLSMKHNKLIKSITSTEQSSCNRNQHESQENKLKEDQHQTNLTQFQSQKKKSTNQSCQEMQIQQQLQCISLKKEHIEHTVLNYQIYIPLYTNSNINQIQ